MIRLLGLVNQNANDLLDAASAVQVGGAGCVFHWDRWAHFIVVLPGCRKAVHFRLAYQGAGRFIGNHLLAPTRDEHQVRSVLAEMPFEADVIELVRVSLPTLSEHNSLLVQLQAHEVPRGKRRRTAQDMSALL